MNRKTIKIGDKTVGHGNPAFIITEVGTNHDRDIEKAKKLIEISAEAGADAVKFQLYEASDIVSGKIKPSDYNLNKKYEEETMLEVFDKYLKTPREWFPELVEHCNKHGVIPMSAVHSLDGAKFIEEVGMKAIKIASMDFTTIPILEEIAKEANIPVILAVGMSYIDEIKEVVEVFEKAEAEYALLHCVSNYPAKMQDLHLNNIELFMKEFDVPIGFSDHTINYLSSCLAVAKNAAIIEKHITLDRSSEGPDHPSSLNPDELIEFVAKIRESESAMGGYEFNNPGEEEIQKRKLYRRSVVTTRNIAKGEKLSEEDVKLTRPGTGVEPKYLKDVVGKTAVEDIEAETPLEWGFLN